MLDTHRPLLLQTLLEVFHRISELFVSLKAQPHRLANIKPNRPRIQHILDFLGKLIWRICLRRYWWFEDVDEEHFVVCEKEVLGEELAHKAARSGDCNLHGWRELLIEMWILVVQWTVMLEARLM
ncbi:hypothetical protein KCV06_g555, partial [Aureobasidium melanogenum]